MNKFILTSLCLALASCKTIPDTAVTGGSKADGMVYVSYADGPYSEPEVDMLKAQEQAKNACSNWGYKNAVPMGGTIKNCTYENAYGLCLQADMQIPFQCIN